MNIRNINFNYASQERPAKFMLIKYHINIYLKSTYIVYVTGSAKTCQDARIFENHFLAFYNSVMQGDYNALCFTSVVCSVAKPRVPPFPALQKKDWNNCV